MSQGNNTAIDLTSSDGEDDSQNGVGWSPKSTAMTHNHDARSASTMRCTNCGRQVPPNNMTLHQVKCGSDRKRAAPKPQESPNEAHKVGQALTETNKHVSKYPRIEDSERSAEPEESTVAYPVRVEGWAGSIHWNSAPEHGRIEDWLNQVKPSDISLMSCSWIFVQNAVLNRPATETSLDLTAYRPALQEIENIIATKKRVPGPAKKACVAQITDIAKKQGATVGKWLLFLKPDTADETWRKIAEATAKGKLGCSSKIAPFQGVTPDNKPILCCVYVTDFSDRADVKRVLQALIDMKIWVSSFKPDVYTHLDIYQNNQWRLDPVLYTVKEALSWDV